MENKKQKKNGLKALVIVSSGIFVIAIIFGILALTGVIFSNTKPTEGLQYSLIPNQNAYEVSIGKATDKNIVIASEYEGKPVIQIAKDGFNGSDIESIVIPKSVTSIGLSAFYGCSGLKSITIPDSVTSIGTFAFYGCSGLESITIPDSVTSIDGYAFYNTGLTSIIIPNSVTSINHIAFSGCSSLTSIKVADGNTVYRSEGNCLIEKSSGILILGCKTSIIPNGVTSIGAFAFYGCSGLESITIPDSVTSIAFDAFYNTGLTSIIILDSVTSIGSYAFDSCSSLTSVIIPDSVTNIGWGAFSECTNLTSIIIPDSVTSIDYGAFLNCSKLAIYCKAESLPSGWNKDWNITNCDVIWGYKG